MTLPEPTPHSASLLRSANLRERGWTEAAIRRYLGEPDWLKPSPYSSRAAPMRIWSAERVERVEQSAEWRQWLAASTRRRRRGLC